MEQIEALKVPDAGTKAHVNGINPKSDGTANSSDKNTVQSVQEEIKPLVINPDKSTAEDKSFDSTGLENPKRKKNTNIFSKIASGLHLELLRDNHFCIIILGECATCNFSNYQ